MGGVLAYVFFAVATRALGAGPAAPVAVLWAWWGFAGAALTFPVQHWIARTAARPAGEAAVRRGLPHVAGAVAAASLVAGAVAWGARERLFGDDGGWFALLVVAVGLGSGLLGVVRGTLSGRHRFGAVAAGLVAENGIRCLVAAGLASAGVTSALAFGGALVAGYAAAALWPAALVPLRSGSGWGDTPLLFLSGASSGQLLAQATLTGGPVLLAAVGGAPTEVTALFAGLALFRAPYTLAIGLVSALTGRITRLVETGREDRLRRIRSSLVAVTVLTAALGAPAGGWLGPGLMELVFGEGVRLPATEAALVAVGTVLALANLVLTVGLLARGRSSAVARTWLVAAPFGLAAYLFLADAPLTRTCWAFVVVEAVAWVGLLLWETRSDRLVGSEEDR